jgi:tRNA (guanine9-N1)-methyltransferase
LHSSYLEKEQYYKKQKQEKAKEAERRYEERTKYMQEMGEHYKTNYPGYKTFMTRLGMNNEKFFDRQKLLCSVRTNEPSVVIDFRFINQHTRIEVIKSLGRQLGEIITFNRNSKRPFQIHFCNYDASSKFHRLYENVIGLDVNLIQETPNSYLDVFPREKLVYLSSDASKEMEEYDPNKVYIIGFLIDGPQNETKFFTRRQAHIDKIECRRLPLDRLR